MDLIADYVRPYRGRRRYGKCRVRIFHEEGGSSSMPVVICSEVFDNSYLRIRSVAEYIAAETIIRHNLPRPIWIEHYPPESNPGSFVETFDLVTFSSYEPERVIIGGTRRVRLGKPEWKPLDRPTIETLIGQPP